MTAYTWLIPLAPMLFSVLRLLAKAMRPNESSNVISFLCRRASKRGYPAVQYCPGCRVFLKICHLFLVFVERLDNAEHLGVEE